MSLSRPLKPKIVAYRRHLLVCTGRRCVEDGMDAAALNDLARRLTAAGVLGEGAGCVKPSRVDCLGACGSGPVVCVQPDGVWYWDVKPPEMDRIIEQHLVQGRAVDELVFHRGPVMPEAEP